MIRYILYAVDEQQKPLMIVHADGSREWAEGLTEEEAWVRVGEMLNPEAAILRAQENSAKISEPQMVQDWDLQVGLLRWQDEHGEVSHIFPLGGYHGCEIPQCPARRGER